MQTNKKGTKKMGNYLDQKELYNEYKKSVEGGQCTERLGELFLTLTYHILRSPSCNRSSYQIKEDLSGHAIVKLMKSLKTVNLALTP